ncbi:L-rhamnose mutarotase [Yangia mangrovi]|uniref:L-rhamnose mutarotase n=1 Tax=Alloyangia mangrovi TaxID=1779329 RepID=A0A2A3JUX4_9RHOB|nr:L-rhamnose mutarotase [Alloyangia mangrovi]MCA0939506.1 L-rhamnose mutarotase [Alloyangia pacifica]MCA0943473.1 L-rhamnose mutarotase [Alloyangia pacifica]MCT4371726.1 L-rhamnose mutarotase [Alloyangia mangrovi]
MTAQRHGQIIAVDPAGIAEYKRLHAAVWPQVLAMITACNIRNYSIFLKEPENLLFAYFEYVGTDFDADMAKMAADPVTQDWWALCMPLQRPLETRDEGAWWAEAEEVFHLE